MKNVILMVDGKEVKFGNDVKLIYPEMGQGDDELHVTLTHEGVISDVISDGQCIGTSAIEAQDIYETLMSGNDPMAPKTDEGEGEWGA